MKKWSGAAGISVNDKAELLMVLEGRLEGTKKWSVPSGGLEDKETFEECVLREIEEETGYIGEIVEKLDVKSGLYEDINVAFEVHYFLVKIIGGQPQIQDPDNLICDIDWKSEAELKNLDLNYPEDREFLIDHILRNTNSGFLV